MAGKIFTTALDQAALDQIAARLKRHERAHEAARARDAAEHIAAETYDAIRLYEGRDVVCRAKFAAGGAAC
jgi:hypothetical protein